MLQQALDRSDNGIYMIDKDYKTVFVNKKCEEMLNINREDAIGVHIDEFLSRIDGYRRFLSLSLENREEYEKSRFEYIWNGETRIFTAKTRILKDGDTIIGAYVEFIEVTSQVLKERELGRIIKELSSNIIPVMDRIGVLPMQPTVGNDQIFLLTDYTLNRCSELRIEHLIIDLTAVYSINDSLVSELTQLIAALQLLGTEVYVSGIQPMVSAAIVSSGYAFPVKDGRTFAHLSQVLKELGNDRS
ncbi:PAS domain S-box-containing protein [Bacillus sp. OV194]|nr:PAS domain S-box-containing protein [Bacillus sp. OV194]